MWQVRQRESLRSAVYRTCYCCHSLHCCLSRKVSNNCACLGLSFAGVVVLSSMLSDPRARYMLAVQGLSWVAGLMPALQMYAFAFFAIPSVRWAIYAVRNQAINARNAARLAAAQAVNGPDRWLNRVRCHKPHPLCFAEACSIHTNTAIRS